MAKMFEIKSQVQKLALLEKEYFPSGCTYDAKTCLVGFQGGALLAHKCIFTNSRFWLSYYMLKKFRIQ